MDKLDRIHATRLNVGGTTAKLAFEAQLLGAMTHYLTDAQIDECLECVAKNFGATAVTIKTTC